MSTILYLSNWKSKLIQINDRSVERVEFKELTEGEVLITHHFTGSYAEMTTEVMSIEDAREYWLSVRNTSKYVRECPHRTSFEDRCVTCGQWIN